MKDLTKEDLDLILTLELEKKDKEIERLNKKIEQYENPEDMTLMFMWCDEKAKDEIKRLNNKIKSIVYQCYNSDMSYEEFKQIWVNAMGKIYEPSQIDELKKELGVEYK